VETEEESTTRFDEWFPMVFLLPGKLALRFLDQAVWVQWVALFVGAVGIVLLVWSLVESVRDRLSSRIFGHAIVSAIAVTFGFQAVDFLT
jgi:hypothetical protein